MYGVYSWNAGASGANIVADLVKFVTGADVASLSASCNKPATVREGAASVWSAVDSGFGVVASAGLVTGPGVTGRMSVSASQKIQLSAVDAWDSGSHSAGFATSVFDVSLSIASAGSVNIVSNDGVLLIAAADWSVWGIVAEVSREGPAMSGAPTVSGALILNNTGQSYMTRCKSPGSAGETTSPYLTVQPAYGSLTSSSARDRAEHLYLVMCSLCVSYSSVPIGEVEGVEAVGGYAQSGDFVLDSEGNQFQVVRGSIGFGVLRV
ncbi:MAG: hypothetical protein J5X22_09400 [Candidatus Accumulibacter sp.]|uniref:hypothetical protein n=1 Tax=Accumulibacter sp. TaxID=2053492 RepID=UPI001AC4CAA7|nr:hypothetical protein [Accumulibacter sp.]MBN8516800.1 hypothetical protein [Accumulibacter sp.]MBO3710717.1 hypothetical protein [Accumulibacter sp.]